MHKIRISISMILIVLCGGFVSAQPDQEPVSTEVFIYNETSDPAYGYRIPSMVTTAEGTLLAFAERRLGLHDHAQNDIVLRRSLNNGKSWQAEQVIAEDGRNSLNDPSAVVLDNGRILLIYQKFPYGIHARNSGWIQMADNGYDGPRNTRSYIIHSDDDGLSWSEAREITKLIRPSGKLSIGSPGRSIQLKRGAFKGRIIVPLYETRRLEGGSRDWQNSVAWSDDYGTSWHLSNEIPQSGHTGFGNEAQVAELSDGSILFVARNQGGKYRKYSISRDGGLTWDNMKLDFGLPGTACMGSIIRYSWPEDGESLLIQASPANMYGRNQGTVRISMDEGKTWLWSRQVVSGDYAYSCLTRLPDGNIGLLYETERYRKIAFTSFSPEWVKQGNPVSEPEPYLSIPVVDLDGDHSRQVVVDREAGQYLGHPSTLLLEDQKTILTTYPKGHGRGAIVYKKSTDTGLTWSERLETPQSWETSKEVPTLFRVEDKYGKKRIVMFSGLYPARMAVSEDDGLTWSELEQVGDWGGIVVMGCMIELKTGKGHYMTFFHDDKRFFTRDGQKKYEKDKESFNSRMFTLYKSLSVDGGLTWSYPEEIVRSREIHICEPGVIRSPDGSQIAVLLRENSRRDNSQIIFSGDEGKTWTAPRPMPNALTGDRHVCKYAPDGRLLVVFRDRSPAKYHRELVRIARETGESNYSKLAAETGLGSPTEGDWVAWVGSYEDLVKGTEGEYRIRIKDNKKGWDTTYPGVELLPDGTFVTTTYGHWEKGEEPFIISVRFSLDETDSILVSKNNK